MRDLVTQIGILFIVTSVAIELAAWAAERWLGEKWWQKLLPERSPSHEQQPVRIASHPD